MIARALSFEDGAHAYDAYRPGYPQELLDDVLEFAGDGAYGLVVAAQSFHRTDPDTRWARLVGPLAPDGAAAMFWTHWSLAPAANDVDGIRDSLERTSAPYSR